MNVPGSAVPEVERPVSDDDPFVTADRIPVGVPAQSVSRYGAPQWNMSLLQGDAHAAAVTVSWDRYDDLGLCSSMRRAGWCLINRPTPQEPLERKATSRVLWRSPGTIYGYLTGLRGFANWLTGRGIGALAEVTVEDLEDYAVHNPRQGKRQGDTDPLRHQPALGILPAPTCGRPDSPAALGGR